MANICLACDKRPRAGQNVSHANNKTKRMFFPNVHKIRFRMKGQTSIKRGAICTRCVRSGKVEKVI